MKKTIMLVLASLCFAGCMSDNKTWVRLKELEVKEATKTQQTTKTAVEGPATLTLEQGGKATFEAGK